MKNRRIKLHREKQLDPRDQTIKEMQDQISKLQLLLETTRMYNLSIKLKCLAGQAAFNGEITLYDIYGAPLSNSFIKDNEFRSSRRKDTERVFDVPLFVKAPIETQIKNLRVSPYSEVSIGLVNQSEWQSKTVEELKRKKELKHISNARQQRQRKNNDKYY